MLFVQSLGVSRQEQQLASRLLNHLLDSYISEEDIIWRSTICNRGTATIRVKMVHFDTNRCRTPIGQCQNKGKDSDHVICSIAYDM